MGKAVAMTEVEESIQANNFVPEPAVLETWTTRKWTDGVQIDELKQSDTLVVETAHHTYEMTVIDPSVAEVLISGGECFPKPTVARVVGASLGRSFLKLRGIYGGLKIELRESKRLIVTSPVRKISVCAAEAASPVTGALTYLANPRTLVSQPRSGGRG